MSPKSSLYYLQRRPTPYQIFYSSPNISFSFQYKNIYLHAKMNVRDFIFNIKPKPRLLIFLVQLSIQPKFCVHILF